MRITFIVALLVIALSVAQTEAWIFPGFFNPLMMMMNPFMFGGLGMFGPFGFGFGMGFRRFGLGFGGLGRRFIGKRGVETIEFDEADKTLCSFTSKDNTISCHGAKSNFQCKVVPSFGGLKSESYRIQNLTVVPDSIAAGKVDHQIYNLFSVRPEHDELNDFTLIEKPEQKVTFAVWKDEAVRRTGLRFVEDKCWEQFETIMEVPETVRFALFINRAPIAKKLTATTD